MPSSEPEASLATLVKYTFGEPVLSFPAGSWHVIDTDEMADLATRMSQTAISHFYRNTRPDVECAGGDSHEWLVLVNSEGKSLVAMTARKKESPSVHQGGRMPVADCHVTGFRNEPVWDDFEQEIRAVAELRGLTVYPNHMGQPLPHAQDAPSP